MKTWLIKNILQNKSFYGALVFAGYGICNEILFTGIYSWVGKSFKGEVSLLMVPVYFISYFIITSSMYQDITRMFPNLFLRSLWIVVIIYAVEFVFGNFYFFVLDMEPWKYKHGWASNFSNGSITLYYAPFWYLFSFIVVRVGDMIEKLSPIIELLFFKETEDFWNDFEKSAEEIKKII